MDDVPNVPDFLPESFDEFGDPMPDPNIGPDPTKGSDGFADLMSFVKNLREAAGGKSGGKPSSVPFVTGLNEESFQALRAENPEDPPPPFDPFDRETMFDNPFAMLTDANVDLLRYKIRKNLERLAGAPDDCDCPACREGREVHADKSAGFRMILKTLNQEYNALLPGSAAFDIYTLGLHALRGLVSDIVDDDI